MTDRRYGGFWRRLFAFLIDGAILYVLSLILLMIVLLLLGLRGEPLAELLASTGDPGRQIGLVALLCLSASLLTGMAYFTLFHGTTGRTPGKMIFGLRVVQISGEPITPGIAFLRWVGYLISAPLFGLGFLWVAWDGRKQGWHDKIAATLVVRYRGHSAADDPLAPTAAATAGMPPSAGTENGFIRRSQPAPE